MGQALHSASQMSRAQLAGIGHVAGAIVRPDLANVEAFERFAASFARLTDRPTSMSGPGGSRSLPC